MSREAFFKLAVTAHSQASKGFVLRVLLVTDYGTPSGGVELIMRMLRDRLRQRGHDVRWFASTADAGGGASEADEHCFGTTGPFRTLLQSANPMARRALSRIVHDFRPDVVHVGMFMTQLSPLILPILRRVPSVFYAQWYRPICPLGTKMLPDGSTCHSRAGVVCLRSGCLPLHDWMPLMAQMKLCRRWMGAFATIVANSQTTLLKLAEDGVKCDEVVLGGVSEVPARPPLRGPPMVAFAGRLVPEKGADILIRAFAIAHARVPEAKLVIAGNGPQREHLRQLVDELALCDCVELTGHLQHAEMEKIFAAAWVQAAPSIWAEPYGLVGPEAMMRGTAVIGTSGGGLAESIEDGRCGILVPPGHVESLAAALVTILSSRDLAEQMGAAGREIALRRFSMSVFVDQFEAIYQRLLQPAGGVDISRTAAV